NAVQPASPTASSSIVLGPVPPAASSSSASSRCWQTLIAEREDCLLRMPQRLFRCLRFAGLQRFNRLFDLTSHVVNITRSVARELALGHQRSSENLSCYHWVVLGSITLAKKADKDSDALQVHNLKIIP